MSKCAQRMLDRLQAYAEEMPPTKWHELASMYSRMGWTVHVDLAAPTLYAYHYDRRRHGEQAHRFRFPHGTGIDHQIRIIHQHQHLKP